MPDGILKGVSEEVEKTVKQAKKQIAPGEFVKEGVEQLTGKAPKPQVGDEVKKGEEGKQVEELKKKEEERQRQIAYWRKVIEEEKRFRQTQQEQTALRQRTESEKVEKEKKRPLVPSPTRIGQGPPVVRGPAGRPQRGIPAIIERKKKGAEIKEGRKF